MDLASNLVGPDPVGGQEAKGWQNVAVSAGAAYRDLSRAVAHGLAVLLLSASPAAVPLPSASGTDARARNAAPVCTQNSLPPSPETSRQRRPSQQATVRQPGQPQMSPRGLHCGALSTHCLSCVPSR